MTQIKRFGRLVGDSRQMRRVYTMIRKGAAVDMPVLIIGETGSGKELVARELHDRSERRRGPFVAFNTGAVSNELIASELFGHKQGAFTGATDDELGRLREAHGGTLFLDEIGTMDTRMQIALLRALEEKKIRPIGAKRDVPTDFRLVAATNENLESAVREGRFREDLYYRLKVLCIKLPALRHRSDDIPMLCKDFIRSINREYEFDIQGISPEALESLLGYEWPGNLRELKNVLAQATVTASTGIIQLRHMPGRVAEVSDHDFGPSPHDLAQPAIALASERPGPPPGNGDNGAGHGREAGENGIFIPAGHTLDEVQRAYTPQTLARCNNNKTLAARQLNVSRKALYDKLVRWGAVKTSE